MSQISISRTGVCFKPRGHSAACAFILPMCASIVSVTIHIFIYCLHKVIPYVKSMCMYMDDIFVCVSAFSLTFRDLCRQDSCVKKQLKPLFA